MNNGVPRILIIRLSAIGDVVRVLPALHSIRHAYPDAQIDWAVERKSAAVLEDHPDIDNVVVYERPGEFWTAVGAFWSFLREIQANRYDIVIDFHGILKSGLITGFSRAPKRYGFARPRSQEGSYLFTNKRVKLFSNSLNRIEENQQLCSALGIKSTSLESTIAVSHEVQEEVDVYCEATFDGGKWVVAMHAPIDRPEKQWPLTNYAELADMLMADGRFEVVLTWGPGQFDVVEEVLAHTRHKLLVAPATPDLKHYAWLTHRADLYIGGDTGPMHIAAAMGTSVVAIFGGTDPAKHAPLHQPSEALYAADVTGPNTQQTAEKRLESITPEMVYDACIRVATA